MTEQENGLWAKAEQLASRNYSITVSLDTLTTGEQVFLLEHPELPGCMAHGGSIVEALGELQEATISYIYYLLVDGLEVPSPLSNTRTLTTLDEAPSESRGIVAKGEPVTFSGALSQGEADELLDAVIQPERRQRIAKFSFIESHSS